jgi:hypothetical protein
MNKDDIRAAMLALEAPARPARRWRITRASCYRKHIRASAGSGAQVAGVKSATNALTFASGISQGFNNVRPA